LIASKNNSITILVHGFNKNKNDMFYLENGLNKYGFKTFSVNLPTTFGTFEECRNSFYLQINDFIKDYNSVNYVAHSMGGLIVRDYIEYTNQHNVDKCIFIATPHNGSKLAEIATFIPFYKNIFKSINALLPNNKLSYKNLNIRIGLIVGDKNKGILGKLFLSKDSDGLVETSSVKTIDANEVIILHFGHKEIHQQYETLIYVKQFLTTATFVTIKK